MAICPLPFELTQDLYQGLTTLMPHCIAAACPYVRSEDLTDDPPSRCVLLVVALLDPSRHAGAHGRPLDDRRTPDA